MAGSLQDQLVQMGLAKAEQAVKKKPHKKPHVKRKPRPAVKKKTTGEMDLAKAYAIRSKVETKEKAETERIRKEKLAASQAANKALQELVEKHAVDRSKGEHERYFEHRSKIRKLFLTVEQNQSLEKGELALIYVKGRYHLINQDKIEVVNTHRPAALVLHFDGSEEVEE